MKTAQEEVGKFSLPNANWIELVKQIQLDAWKQGMSDAAELHKTPHEPFELTDLRSAILVEKETKQSL